MKIENSSVDILNVEPGIVGMLRSIEKSARVCYASQDRMTDTSYSKFIENVLISNGHWAALELGTVYLKCPKYGENIDNLSILSLIDTKPFTRYNSDSFNYYITTNYRIIKQFGLEKFMEKYWCEPDDNFKKKVLISWECSRAIANELIRHRAFSPMQQSTRYCNFIMGKFNGDISIIIPEWIKNIGLKYGIDLNANPSEFNKLLDYDDIVKNRYALWLISSKEYRFEIENGIKPEDARGALIHDLKTILYQSGFIEDFTYKPVNSKEKAGFFNLRSDKTAHPDVRVLSIKLEELFKIKNIK